MTHPRIFDPPAPLDRALELTNALLAQPGCVCCGPVRATGSFVGLARAAAARGNLLADSYLAAVVMESGCTLVTNDRDFARFPGLRWQPPEAA